MSPRYLLALAVCALAQPPPGRLRLCCEPGYTLVDSYPDGVPGSHCSNTTADEDGDYYYYEEGLEDAACPPELLRVAAFHAGDEEPAWPPAVCADPDAGAGLFCDATYLRCCGDRARYDPDARACVPAAAVDALDAVPGGNAPSVRWPVRCGPLAVVDDFAPASMLEVSDDGRLLMVARGARRELEPGGFCLEGTTFGAQHVVVRHCQPVARACSERLCFRKCCDDGEAFHQDGTCLPSSSSGGFKVSRIPTSYDVVAALGLPAQRNFTFVEGFAVAHGLECTAGKYSVDPWREDPSVFAENGDVSQDGSVLDVSSYCLDALDGGLVAVMCFPDSADDRVLVPLHITVGLILSSVFLLATVAVYALLPALLNLHGKTLMCHVVSLLGAYVCLTCSHLSIDTINETGWCVAIAYILIFSFMAAFSWLNVMCFDIWWTFSTVRCVTQGSRQQRERRRFLWYNLYAWSLSTLVALLTYVAEVFEDSLPLMLRPQIANETCFYSRSTHAQKLLFELPVAALIVANTAFFVMTARNCYKVKAELQRLQSKEGERGKRRFESNKNKLITTAKLFFVMGVTWVMEFTASLCSPGNQLWIPADIANSLQGVFIFCIFVLKRKVLMNLWHRMRCLKTCLRRDGSAIDRGADRARSGYDLWRMRKISSSSTLYTNSTLGPPHSSSRVTASSWR